MKIATFVIYDERSGGPDAAPAEHVPRLSGRRFFLAANAEFIPFLHFFDTPIAFQFACPSRGDFELLIGVIYARWPLVRISLCDLPTVWFCHFQLFDLWVAFVIFAQLLNYNLF